MNKKQKICLWVGAFILVIVTIYPHWRYKSNFSPNRRAKFGQNDRIVQQVDYTYYGRKFFLDKRSSKYGSYEINKVRLYIEAGLTATLTLGLVYTLKDEKLKDEQNKK